MLKFIETIFRFLLLISGDKEEMRRLMEAKKLKNQEKSHTQKTY